MAKIVFVFHDFWKCKRGDEFVYPPFYDGLINEFKKNGNEIHCFINPITAKKFDYSGKISRSLLAKLKKIDPDLFILVNNRLWDITEYFDCPIICYGTDSPPYYGNTELLKQKKDRFKFVVQQSCEIETIQSSFKVSKKNIEYILSTTPIKNTHSAKDKNISFLGSQWLWEGLTPLVDYMKRNPTSRDSVLAHEIHSAMINNIDAKSYDDIIKEIYAKHPDYPAPKLIVENQDLYIGRMSGIRRARYLTKIADLGLEIYGTSWATPCMAYFPELALNYTSTPIITTEETEKLYNSSHICFQLNHIQAKSGFSWKIADIMASGSCLVANSTEDFKKLFGKNIPTYETEAEARELCQKILKNPNMQKDIVSYSNEKVEEMFRPRRALAQLEHLSGIKLLCETKKAGKVYMEMLDLSSPDKKQAAPPLSTFIPGTNIKKPKGFKKVKYKIWKHLNKQFSN